MAGWIIAQCHRGKERWAASNIRRQNHECYLPEIWNPRRQLRELLFPPYLFVLIRSGFSFVCGTYGVSRVLMMGDQPSPVRKEIIEELKERENRNGCIVLPDRYRRNQSLQIKAGLFAGHQGLYQGLEADGRARVLLFVLGSPTTITLSHRHIAA